MVYTAELAQVRAVALAAMQGFPGLLTDQPVEVMLTAFADSALTFRLRFWIPYQKQFDYVGAKSEAIMRLEHAFDAAGIVIPFPIRTLDISAELLTQLGQKLASPPAE